MSHIVYKFKIEPNEKQKEAIFQTLSLCRWLYNTALEQRMYVYKTHQQSLSFYTQKKELPQLKKEFPVFKSVHSQVLQNVLERLDKAYQSFFRRLKKGEKAGFPRFKGKNRYHSFVYPQSGFSLQGKYMTLSKIGDVRIKKHREVQGNVKSSTVIHKNGKFYVSLMCEIESQERLVIAEPKAVGIDLGVSHLAITSDGNFFDNPKHLHHEERKLKRLQRAVSKKTRGSNRRKKAVQLLAKQHERIANKRRDTAHKISRQLVEQYSLIVFEDLNIQGMVKNHRLAQRITDSAWRQLIRFTTYKAENAGKEVRLVNPYNTSQKCSSCGSIVKKSLSERTHSCACGYEDHRDVNASKNILKLGLMEETA